jgi:DNA-binding CsgD family transcriptional regulator
MSRDIIGILEAIYRVEAEPDMWLTRILEAARPLMDAGLGLSAGTYDAVGPTLAVEAFVSVGVPDGSSEKVRATSYDFTPEYVDKAFLGHVCEAASSISGWDDLAFVRDGTLLPFGIRDRIGINGLSTDCSGTIIGIHLPVERGLSPAERRTYAKIACHLGAAHRLRRRLKQGIASAEAVLSPSGRIEHAEGTAADRDALARLTGSARAIDQARSRKGRRNQDQALSEWTSMVEAQWTLVEAEESDGRRYLFARRNDPVAPGPEQLSERERQVISYALMGHHNKLIAYELGISHSTVRVLLHRAGRKLGVGSRAELVDLGRTMLKALRPC